MQICPDCGAEMKCDGNLSTCGACGRQIHGNTPPVEGIDNLCRQCQHPLDPEHDALGCNIPDCPCAFQGKAIEEPRDVLPNADAPTEPVSMGHGWDGGTGKTPGSRAIPPKPGEKTNGHDDPEAWAEWDIRDEAGKEEIIHIHHEGGRAKWFPIGSNNRCKDCMSDAPADVLARFKKGMERGNAAPGFQQAIAAFEAHCKTCPTCKPVREATAGSNEASADNLCAKGQALLVADLQNAAVWHKNHGGQPLCGKTVQDGALLATRDADMNCPDCAKKAALQNVSPANARSIFAGLIDQGINYNLCMKIADDLTRGKEIAEIAKERGLTPTEFAALTRLAREFRNAAPTKCAGCGKQIADVEGDRRWDSYDTGKSWCKECDATKAQHDPNAGKGGEGDRGLGPWERENASRADFNAYGQKLDAAMKAMDGPTAKLRALEDKYGIAPAQRTSRGQDPTSGPADYQQAGRELAKLERDYDAMLKARPVEMDNALRPAQEAFEVHVANCNACGAEYSNAQPDPAKLCDEGRGLLTAGANENASEFSSMEVFWAGLDLTQRQHFYQMVGLAAQEPAKYWGDLDPANQQAIEKAARSRGLLKNAHPLDDAAKEDAGRLWDQASDAEKRKTVAEIGLGIGIIQFRWSQMPDGAKAKLLEFFGLENTASGINAASQVWDKYEPPQRVELLKQASLVDNGQSMKAWAELPDAYRPQLTRTLGFENSGQPAQPCPKCGHATDYVKSVTLGEVCSEPGCRCTHQAHDANRELINGSDWDRAGDSDSCACGHAVVSHQQNTPKHECTACSCAGFKLERQNAMPHVSFFWDHAPRSQKARILDHIGAQSTYEKDSWDGIPNDVRSRLEPVLARMVDGKDMGERQNRDVMAKGGEEAGKPGGTITVINAAPICSCDAGDAEKDPDQHDGRCAVYKASFERANGFERYGGGKYGPDPKADHTALMRHRLETIPDGPVWVEVKGQGRKTLPKAEAMRLDPSTLLSVEVAQGENANGMTVGGFEPGDRISYTEAGGVKSYGKVRSVNGREVEIDWEPGSYTTRSPMPAAAIKHAGGENSNSGPTFTTAASREAVGASRYGSGS